MSIRLMTSNIRYDGPNDGIHTWSHRKYLLSNLMRSYNLDFLGTQEGRKKQILELEELINPLKIVDSHRKWIDERMYPCLFVNTTKNQITNSGDFWLSETPDIPGSSSFDSKYPRLTTWLEAKVKNKTFFIFNTHIDHILESTRLCQLQVICNQIKKINSKNAPMILMGDFNASPSGPERKLLLENLPQFYDPWSKLNMKEESSHHPFDGIGKGGNRIDWILASKELTITKIILDKSNEGARYPSDHFPVYAEITI